MQPAIKWQRLEIIKHALSNLFVPCDLLNRHDFTIIGVKDLLKGYNVNYCGENIV